MAVVKHPFSVEQHATESVFARVVVGVDGTEPSFEACRQAGVLAEPGTPIEAVAVVHLADAIHAGTNAPHAWDVLEREAEAALEQAASILGARVEKRFVNGFAAEALRREAAGTGATLLAIGSHGHRRLAEILIGGVAGELLHSAPCSVLVARPPARPADFPRSIVVGVDGSPASDRALAVGRQLEQRFGASLRVIAATGGKNVDLAHVHLRTPFAEELPERPVEALVAASAEADLVVVGNRGLHGLRALGSVSERVAHRASCSVLVVRPEHAG
jgi:nucleotide-binding universal stress UspA family protein